MAAALHLLLFTACVGGLFIHGAVSQENPGCPEGWSHLGSRCFIYQNTPNEMMVAEGNCRAIGGHLASIHSEEENWFLSELIRRQSGTYHRTWIGLHDALKEREWVWTDGSNTDFVKWGPGEPNNHGGSEQCVEMNFNVQLWNDIPCQNHPRPYICSRDV